MAFTDKQIQIIDTAEKLFACKGYDGTSVRDIAEAAGVNIAMISYYFGSKEKLIQALFEERTNHFKIKIESLLKDETLTPLAKLENLADDYIQRVMHKMHFHKIMVYEQLLEKNSFITSLLKELKKENAELIQKIIEDGQQKGAFKKDLDSMLLQNTIIGTVSQTIMNKEYYKFYHGLEEMDDGAFFELLKNKLSTHIKGLFKSILTYEA